jgi:hypothetical protein
LEVNGSKLTANFRLRSGASHMVDGGAERASSLPARCARLPRLCLWKQQVDRWNVERFGYEEV